MAFGPGKYDQQLSDALKACNAATGALMVFDGDVGMGFACQLTAFQMEHLPATLRFMADTIERDGPAAT